MNLLTYSFYYEVIPYSLRNVVNSPTKYVSVYQRLISYDISKMIKTFLDYLLSMEVIYVIRL